MDDYSGYEHRYDDIDDKLRGMAEASPSPPGWYEAMTNLGPESTEKDRLDVYQAIHRSGCLLEDDPEIVNPEVLADDRAKYEASGDQKYVEKARRRGKFGWDVGRHIEVIPHYRRPHLMLAWTGAGRSVPKIVPRKGSIVHRNVVEKLPTGFEGEG